MFPITREALRGHSACVLQRVGAEIGATVSGVMSGRPLAHHLEHAFRGCI
jgi:hypothetical protein